MSRTPSIESTLPLERSGRVYIKITNGGRRPNHHIISSHCHIRVRVLLVLVFLVKLRLIRCNCDDKSFYSDPGPPLLISSTVSIRPLRIEFLNPYFDSASYTSAISDCVFILSCLCSSIRLQEKPSRRGNQVVLS